MSSATPASMAGSSPPADAASGKPPRSALVLGTLVLGAIAANMNLGIANVALPTIGRELGGSQAQLTAVANSFSLGLACSVLYLGALGDRYGRKLMFLIGAALSIPAALLSAWAPSIEMLIGARFAAGVAAALVFPTTLSLVSALFRGPAQTRAIAIWSGVGGGFAALGPLIGGLLLAQFWWGSVFLVTVPLVGAAFVLGLVALPWKAGERSGPVDHLGGILSVVGVASFVIALQLMPSFKWAQVGTLVALAAVMVVFFLRQQRRAPDPLVDLKAARTDSFWVAAVAGTVTFGSLMGAMLIGQQFTQNVLGYSALNAALTQLPLSIALIVCSIPAGQLMLKKGGRFTLTVGLAIAELAFLWMLVFWKQGAAEIHLLIAYALVGIGVGIAVVPASKALMASLPVSRAGMGSAFTDLTRDFGGAVMNALMGSALAIVYTGYITKQLAKVPPAQAQQLSQDATAQLLGSFEGAEAVAQQYPPYQQRIMDAAATGFVEGKSVAVLIAMVATIGAIALVLWKFPSPRDEQEVYSRVAEESRREAEAASSLPS